MASASSETLVGRRDATGEMHDEDVAAPQIGFVLATAPTPAERKRMKRQRGAERRAEWRALRAEIPNGATVVAAYYPPPRKVERRLNAPRSQREPNATRPPIQSQSRAPVHIPHPRRSSVRAPRTRRVERSTSTRGSPRSTSADDGDPDVDPCPRCGGNVAVVRGVPTCAVCWAQTVLALEERRA